MLQKPNTVFVGTQVNAAPETSFAAGDIVLIDAATGAVKDLADIADCNSIQLGLVKADGTTINKTQVIGKSNVKNLLYNAYAAKTEAAVSIDWTGVTLVAGYRYVVRIIYKDLYEHPGQFTHSYEVIATAADTVDTLGASFAAKINAHKGARATATYTAGTDVLLITAKTITANMASMAGKEGISRYSQVQMAVATYYTIPGSPFSGGMKAIPGIVTAVTVSDPGKGNPYVIRDREQDALSYKGITYRTTWPIIKPELNVDLAETYDEFVIEFDKAYQSPDNQYVKATDLAAEIYTEAGEGTSDLDDLRTAIAVWAGLEEAVVIP